MKNNNSGLNKFFANKHTVTILGLAACLVILYFGYEYRINQKITFRDLPSAKEDIKPRTKISSDKITLIRVPEAFLVGTYYSQQAEIVGKYSNYNTMIKEGSLFYKDLVVDDYSLPDYAFLNVPEGETVVNYFVDMDSTYANSMKPGDKINIYFKALNDKGEVMFGKFIENVKILDVKDANGNHVFNSDNVEVGAPAYMFFSLRDDIYLLFSHAVFLAEENDVELTIIPNTQTLTEENTVSVKSSDIKDFIEGKIKEASSDVILSEYNSEEKKEDNKAKK